MVLETTQDSLYSLYDLYNIFTMKVLYPFIYEETQKFNEV